MTPYDARVWDAADYVVRHAGRHDYALVICKSAEKYSVDRSDVSRCLLLRRDIREGRMLSDCPQDPGATGPRQKKPLAETSPRQPLLPLYEEASK